MHKFYQVRGLRTPMLWLAGEAAQTCPSFDVRCLPWCCREHLERFFCFHRRRDRVTRHVSVGDPSVVVSYTGAWL